MAALEITDYILDTHRPGLSKPTPDEVITNANVMDADAEENSMRAHRIKLNDGFDSAEHDDHSDYSSESSDEDFESLMMNEDAADKLSKHLVKLNVDGSEGKDDAESQRNAVIIRPWCEVVQEIVVPHHYSYADLRPRIQAIIPLDTFGVAPICHFPRYSDAKQAAGDDLESLEYFSSSSLSPLVPVEEGCDVNDIDLDGRITRLFTVQSRERAVTSEASDFWRILEDKIQLDWRTQHFGGNERRLSQHLQFPNDTHAPDRPIIATTTTTTTTTTLTPPPEPVLVGHLFSLQQLTVMTEYYRTLLEEDQVLDAKLAKLKMLCRKEMPVAHANVPRRQGPPDSRSDRLAAFAHFWKDFPLETQLSSENNHHHHSIPMRHVVFVTLPGTSNPGDKISAASGIRWLRHHLKIPCILLIPDTMSNRATYADHSSHADTLDDSAYHSDAWLERLYDMPARPPENNGICDEKVLRKRHIHRCLWHNNNNNNNKPGARAAETKTDENAGENEPPRGQGHNDGYTSKEESADSSNVLMDEGAVVVAAVESESESPQDQEHGYSKEESVDIMPDPQEADDLSERQRQYTSTEHSQSPVIRFQCITRSRTSLVSIISSAGLPSGHWCLKIWEWPILFNTNSKSILV